MAPTCLTTKTLKDSSSQYNQIIKLHMLIKLSSVNRQHVYVCNCKRSYFKLSLLVNAQHNAFRSVVC